MMKKRISDVVTIREFEETLCRQNNSGPIGRSATTEESTRLYLYYNSKDKHVGTYNRDNRNGWYFSNV